MTVATGSHLGPYEIGDRIGVGGMGEVFRATDTKLKRQVAVKVLPDSFATDQDRLSRFQREAEILASLNHPNIAQIYGLEHDADTTALIMELVEGPTLADRIAEGPVPPDEALAIARQIIDALEAAHEQHIVHRDLKPANIKLRDDGTVKVLDFGIAKPIEARGISGGSVPPPLKTPAMTETGLIMGTAAYMSPEQARGRSVDQRTDIWAFGCILFEMLTGQPAFGGEDVTVTLARVIERDTDLGSMPGTISPAVVQALKLCLMKDPRHRIADVRDVRLALAGEFESAGVDPGRVSRPASGWRLALPVALAAALIAGLGAWFAAPRGERIEAGHPQTVRYTLPINDPADDDNVGKRYLGGADAARGWPALNALALSHNGTRLAFAVSELDADGRASGEILLQRLEQERPMAVAGTENGYEPFFSPNDEWLGFFQQGAMKRVSLVNGSVETLVSDPENFRAGIWGAQWIDDGTIVYGGYNGLFRIRDNGTDRETLLALDRTQGEFAGFVMPYLLPGGRTLLFHSVKTTLRPEDAEIRALDLATGAQRVLLSDAQDPWYLSATGQLMFVRRGTLMAVRFDPVTLTLDGEPVVVLENVVQAQGMPSLSQESGVAQVAYSPAGHLAFAAGGTYPKPEGRMIRVTPDGEAERFIPDEYRFLGVRLSPDGSRAAFGDYYGVEADLYIHDLQRGITRQLNTGTEPAPFPLWSPDGQSIVFTAGEATGVRSMFRILANGSGEPERLLPEDNVSRSALSVAATGAIAFLRQEPGAPAAIWVLTPEGQPEPFVVSDSDVRLASFSPDANWIVYESTETGTGQVMVRPYPQGEPATQVSVDGGTSPGWSRDGRTIFFVATVSDDGQPARRAMMRASFTPGDPPTIGRVETYIDPWPFVLSSPLSSYDVLDDGSIITAANENSFTAFQNGTALRSEREINGLTEIKVVLNFAEEMRQRAGLE